MSRAAKFKQADVTRLVKGALRAGLAFDSFKVAVENGALVLSLKDAPTPSEKDAEDGIRR